MHRSAADVARELAAILPDARTTIVLPASHRSRRPALLLTAAALAAVALAAVAAAVLSTGGSKAPPPRVAPRVAPVPHAATAQQQARELASWLLRYSR